MMGSVVRVRSEALRLRRVSPALRSFGASASSSPVYTFTERAMLAFGGQAIALSHPLGGCRIADDVVTDVVDRHGRVFDAREGAGAAHDGLYVADGPRIPTALGINPSLTISALALRTADAVIDDLILVAAQPGSGTSQPLSAQP